MVKKNLFTQINMTNISLSSLHLSSLILFVMYKENITLIFSFPLFVFLYLYNIQLN